MSDQNVAVDDGEPVAPSAPESPVGLLARGLGETLTEADLLGVLLGARSRGDRGFAVGRELLETTGGLRRLARAGMAELRGVRGVGPRRLASVRAFFILARRYATEVLVPGTQLRSSGDIYRHYALRFRDKKKEQFVTVMLDGKHRVIRDETVSEGSLTASIVHPREVFMPAIRESAGAIVLVHNHPSGDPTPSFEDIEVTERLVKVGEVVGIRVLDHVIIGEGSFTSFVDRGLIGGGGG